MEDKQKIYLDKVVEFLLRNTIIDYYRDEIQFPFSYFRLPPLSPFPLNPYRHPSPPFFVLPISFSKYCIDVYGLTDQEIKYVWKEYRTIILDKITNGE